MQIKKLKAKNLEPPKRELRKKEKKLEKVKKLEERRKKDMMKKSWIPMIHFPKTPKPQIFDKKI
jgi:hypothetical protein